MLTKLVIRNFKRFEAVEIELGNPVVFIGPNNSGKTTALQALTLWNVGVKKWNEKRGGKKAPEKRPGVTINRRDLFAVPAPDANLLWRDLHVRDVRRTNGGQRTQNIRMDILVEAVTNDRQWQCGLEFDYANEESFYCRPLRLPDGNDAQRMAVPEEAAAIDIAFLPPMSGLAANETRLDPGAVNVRLGEGRTAEVLRNLCYQLMSGVDGAARWQGLESCIGRLFGVRLEPPKYISERGEITMTYLTPGNVRLDLSCAGRGLQQTLLVLAHLAVNPNSVILIDEPDAHLEILRQREIYLLMSELARGHGCQVIAASHSEVVLNEAADRDVVVAFVGKPHRIDDRGSQLLKSLKELGFDQYYQAEQVGWVLYIEGSTDLSILREFADILQHPARDCLERPFVHTVMNQPQKARDHFYGLREAKADLQGIAIFDRLDRVLEKGTALREVMWSHREIENYFCRKDVLLGWARAAAAEQAGGPLFAEPWAQLMEECVTAVEAAMRTLGKPSPWSPETKVTDDFLDPLFKMFFERRGLPNLMLKTNYHVLARYVPVEEIDREVVQMLDSIAETAQKAHPVGKDEEA